MPLILGTNSIKDTGYDVANSLRFNRGSSDSLTRTQSSSPTHDDKGTLSFWFKRSLLGVDQYVFSVFQDSSNRMQMNIKDDDQLKLIQKTGGSTVISLITNRVFRDVSAWYHVVVSIDTTQGTASNRIKIYINGVQETSFGTETYPSQNENVFLTKGTAVSLGAYDSGSSDHTSAYFSEIVMVDGQQLDATSFGEFDEDSGIWKPIDVSGLTFGTNGFYLDFEDSSALGNDANGSNNFTVNNIAATDQATDTCTNNFSVLNPLDNPYPAQPATFSQGNLIGQSTESGFLSGASTIGVSTGKWYAEFKLTAGNMGLSTMGVITDPVDNLGTTAPHDSTKFYGVRGNGDKYQPGGTQTTNWAGSYTTNDIISLALDVDNNYLYVAKNGQYADGSGNYDEAFTGSPAAITIASGQTYFFTGGSISTGGGVFLTMASNFGFPSFAISSGNADSNGYGNFEYAVPSGYFSLNTKNLAEYG